MEGIGSSWLMKMVMILILLLSVVVQANSPPPYDFASEIPSNFHSSVPHGDSLRTRIIGSSIRNIPIPGWLRPPQNPLTRCIAGSPLFCGSFLSSTIEAVVVGTCIVGKAALCVRRHSVAIQDCTITCASSMSTDFGFHVDTVQGYLETCYNNYCKINY